MTLSSREHTFVIVGLVAVLLFLAIQYAAFPLMDQYEAVNSQIEVKASLLQQYQARLHTLPQLEHELAERTAQLHESEQRLVEGQTPALGAANVQLMLDDLSKRQKGIQIKSTRVLDAEEHGVYTKIAVRVALTARITPLTDFLYDLEHQPARLSISELTVRVPNPKKPRDLRADIVVEAIMKSASNEAIPPLPAPTENPRSETA